MGLFGSIGNLVSKATTTVTNVAKNTFSALPVVLSSPVKSIAAVISPTKTFKEVETKFYSQPKATQVAQTVIGGVSIGVGGAAVKAATGIIKSGAVVSTVSNVAKSLIPTTTTGKVAAVVATPVVIGAISSQPVEVAKKVVEAPSQLSNFGSNVANLAINPTVENVKTVVAENPIIAAGAALVVGGAAVKAISPVVGGLLQREAIEDQTKSLTKAIEESKTDIPKTLDTVKTEGKTPVPITATHTQPLVKPEDTATVPNTEPLFASTKSTVAASSKKKKRKLTPTVRQNVNILVQNRNNAISERIIKEKILNIA